MNIHFSTILVLLFFFLVSTSCVSELNKKHDWAHYLGGPDRNHYSELTQITADNVGQLEIAWTYQTPSVGQMQINPLVIDGVLYGVTPTLQACALDAATGEELWLFGDTLRHWASTSRGVSYWSEGDDQRIFYTIGATLWCLDAKTGEPKSGFGNNGQLDFIKVCLK